MSNIVRVAKAAGVSTMTVSRYFNDPEKLRPETRAPPCQTGCCRFFFRVLV